MKSKHACVAVIVIAATMACAEAGSAERDKVDVVTVLNGDRITGEIQSLGHGRLGLETDSMGTVQIEWPDVVRIESPQSFLVEDVDGNLLYGRIARDPQAGYLAVVGGDQITQRVELPRVVRMSQSEARLLDRIHGSFSLGVDYAKSSNIKTLSGAFNTSYRGPKTYWSLGVEMNSTRDPAQGTLDRDSVKYGYRWLKPGGHFWTGLTSFERNEETGVEARILLGGGYGSYFLQTSSNEVAATIGLAAIREWATGAADEQSSLEAFLGIDWRVFDFASPKTNLTAKAVLYPSLTESGRYRADTSISLRREIITDFYLDLSFFQNYDTDPPDVTAENSDYGITTSLGYSF